MDAQHVLVILDQARAAGARVWVDGGWGVDALIGHQRRDHDDLDLVVDANAVERLMGVLLGAGFEVARDWLPTAIAVEHLDGRKVDLHPVQLTSDGGGDQIQRDGITRWHYEAPVTGTIAGQAVACCGVDTQIASHLGYEPDDDDRSDMHALAAAFDRELPPPYSHP